MPRDSNPQLSNAHEPEVNAASAPAESTPEAEVTPTAFHFRKELMKDSKFEVLMGMGEGGYQQTMESLLEDFQLGLESHLVEQMGETFWRTRRSQRIRDGVALENSQSAGRGHGGDGAIPPCLRSDGTLRAP